jgi:3-oxoacyl-[acyl-carrier-protein] synthase II
VNGAKNGKVVITGIGAITPLGHDIETNWSALVAGKSGVGCITRFDATNFATRIAAEVKDFDPTKVMDRKDAKRADRFVQFAVSAADEAVKAARLDLPSLDPDKVGVIIGSGIGGIDTFEAQHKILLERGPDRVSPFFIPMMISNMASGQVSIHLGAKGPNFTTVSACTSSASALGEAYRILQHGDADVVITGGTEATITPMAIAGFCSMKAMSTRNDAPTRASRPFDAERDGFVMGEGAAILVLERAEHAAKRGAPVLCELAGYGATGDAFHYASPPDDHEGALRAMKRALAEAGLTPDDVQYINAHGTSTPLNDRAESAAVRHLMGDKAQNVMLASTKSMTGHLLGAAGGLEAAICALVIARGVVPPTINYEHPDPECDLDCVPNVARTVPVKVALSNSMGFGGHNASLVFRAIPNP